MTRYTIALCIAAALAGCAQEPPPQPVAPVIIKVVSSDHCGIMKRLYGPAGPTWDITDNVDLIADRRRLAAAFRAMKCASPPTDQPTS